MNIQSPVKACVFCRHCEYEEPYSYSTYTGGGGSFECAKRVAFDSDIQSLGAFKIAQNCQHFDLRDDIKNYLASKEAP